MVMDNKAIPDNPNKIKINADELVMVFPRGNVFGLYGFFKLLLPR